jgi:tetratricopeptide (TPR) repeat protein
MVAVVFAYGPAWKAGFIWDDDVYIIQNKLLTAPDGLKRIWFSQDSPSQYFPLVYTMFRFERGIWGLNPAGYHWVNILLHGANALLVWRLLRRLEVPGCWLAAALFALHPVQVETVAWVTERKNVLSVFFVLWALRWWVQFVQEGPRPGWKFYWMALVAYLLALFSKTTACTLPAALVLVLWIQKKPIDRRRWIQIAPFVLIGLAMGLLTVWWERHHVGTSGGVFAIGLLERILIASRAIWFYLAKLFWPVNLTFSYPRWEINPRDPWAYGWLAACVAAAIVIFLVRRRFGRGPEVAALFFVATLSPLLGFIMLFTFRYTFVADHYQYLACLGPLALTAAGIARGLDRLRDNVPFRWVTGGMILVVMGTLTWHRARAFEDVETLWRDTVARNPDSWLAHYNLGRHLMHLGKFDEAMDHYNQTLRLNPRDVDSLVSVGNAWFGKRRYDEAMTYYDRALQVNPDNPEAHVNLAVILANQGNIESAIEHDRKALEANPKHLNAQVNLAVLLARQGRYEEALEHYRRALEINPDQAMTHINLAIALSALGRTNEATTHYARAAASVNKHADELAQQGRWQEAQAQYLEALRLIPNNAEAHCHLAILLARGGNRDQARAHLLEALRISPDYILAQQHLQALNGPSPGPMKRP